MARDTTESQVASDIRSICDQFEKACQAGESPLIEERLQQVPQDNRSELLTKLIRIELCCQQAESTPPSLDAYKDRFPEFPGSVEDAFEQYQQRSLSVAETTSIDEVSTMAPTADNWGSAVGIQRPEKIGRYTIVQELGRGGQGAVYRAVHPNLPIEVAIKISVNPLNEKSQQALRGEAQILCDLDHPNIARIRDLDFFEGRPFLVLDFVRGRSLSARLLAGEVCNEQAVAWLADVARAIDLAHRRGTVHLDLKPENIVIDEHNSPKVIDFGLARMRDAWSDPTAEKDSVSGTLHYMSPEQAVGKAERIGSHSDIFSLGAILYHILVGKPPFEGRDVRQMLTAIREADFDRESLQNGGASAELIGACLKAMSFEPSERFASAAEFADAIAPNPSAVTTRNWTSPLVAMACVAAVIAGMLFAYGIDQSSSDVNTAANQESITAIEPSLPAASKIEQFAITHIGNEKDGAAFTAPIFQERGAREQDDIEVTAQFSKSVYCFLFALNPDGVVQLCFPDSPSEAQSTPITKLKYPPGEKQAFGLTDGAGHQAFVLVSSENPLPSFDDWKSSLPPIPWPDKTITGGWIYSDGNLRPERFASETTGRTRGDVRLKQEPTALRSYLDSIKKAGNMEVKGVVFEIHRNLASQE